MNKRRKKVVKIGGWCIVTDLPTFDEENEIPENLKTFMVPRMRKKERIIDKSKENNGGVD